MNRHKVIHNKYMYLNRFEVNNQKGDIASLIFITSKRLLYSVSRSSIR